MPDVSRSSNLHATFEALGQILSIEGRILSRGSCCQKIISAPNSGHKDAFRWAYSMQLTLLANVPSRESGLISP